MTEVRTHHIIRRYSMRRIAEQAVFLFFMALLLATGFIHSADAADDPKAREIMEKVDARDDGDNGMADMEMLLIDKQGSTRSREIRSRMKDVGEDTHRIMFFI
jgi:hypothetical protein